VGFGQGADFPLLKEISAAADSFAKRVYEGSDAALQLENFYTEISSPLLTDLEFSYVGDLVDNSSLSETQLRTIFKGGQYVVVGEIKEGKDVNNTMKVEVTGKRQGALYKDVLQICLRGPSTAATGLRPSEDIGIHGCLPQAPPARSEAQEFMQSLHAFLNIKQLLKSDKKDKALQLSLTNNLVTPLTSLVVVRPKGNEILPILDDIEDGFSNRRSGVPQLHSFAYAAPPSSQVYSLRASAGNSKVRPNPASIPKRKNTILNFRTTRPPTKWTSPQIDTTSTNRTTTSIIEISGTDLDSSGCSGNLTLYSSTFHRGSSVTLVSDSADLESFSDLAVSALVEGPCCWTVYQNPNFQGQSFQLRPGINYQGTDTFPETLFLEVSSVKKTRC